MPVVEFETTTPVFERAKTVHTLDLFCSQYYENKDNYTTNRQFWGSPGPTEGCCVNVDDDDDDTTNTIFFSYTHIGSAFEPQDPFI
jgi:hypothetical protein